MENNYYDEQADRLLLSIVDEGEDNSFPNYVVTTINPGNTLLIIAIVARCVPSLVCLLLQDLAIVSQNAARRYARSYINLLAVLMIMGTAKMGLTGRRGTAHLQ